MGAAPENIITISQEKSELPCKMRFIDYLTKHTLSQCIIETYDKRKEMESFQMQYMKDELAEEIKMMLMVYLKDWTITHEILPYCILLDMDSIDPSQMLPYNYNKLQLTFNLNKDGKQNTI